MNECQCFKNNKPLTGKKHCPKTIKKFQLLPVFQAYMILPDLGQLTAIGQKE
jgi:hypothetical protein